MVLCECGRKWYYKDDLYEWKIEGGEPRIIKMKSGPPDFKSIELVIYQCPCGKVNGVIAMNLDMGIDTLAREYWGVFTHPDWDDKDIDADI